MERVEVLVGDLRNLGDCQAACEDVDVVFHVASFGMSGKDMLAGKMIYDINVLGTINIVEAAKEAGVECLVHTSTTNVVFSNRAIFDGNEDLPYVPAAEHLDNYSRTKSEAEQVCQRRRRRRRPSLRCLCD